MPDNESRVRYLLINLRWRHYIRIEAGIILALVTAGVVLFVLGRGSGLWWLHHGWWICLGAASLEALEALWASHRARA